MRVGPLKAHRQTDRQTVGVCFAFYDTIIIKSQQIKLGFMSAKTQMPADTHAHLNKL